MTASASSGRTGLNAPGARSFRSPERQAAHASAGHSSVGGQRASSPRHERLQEGRQEPRFADRETPRIDPQYEELQRKYAFYNQFNSFSGPPRLRLWHIAATFFVGAVAGLGAAWSLNSSTLPSLSTKLSRSIIEKAAVQPAGSMQPETAARGIRAGELPYDGATQQAALPPAAGESASAAQPLIASDALARPPAQEKRASSEKQTGAARTRSGEKRRAETQAGASASVQKPVVEARKPSSEKSTKAAAHKRSPQQRISSQDREIARIQQQANEELKKKSESRPPIEERSSPAPRPVRSEAATAGDKVKQVRASYARCDDRDGFIEREKCKWRICGGKWGKNGCPSFHTQPSLY